MAAELSKSDTMTIPGRSAKRPLVSALAGISLAASAATQLRVVGIGPGEILLAVVFLSALVQLAWRGTMALDRNARLYTLVIFNCAFVSLLALLAALVQKVYFEDWLRQYFFILFTVLFPFVFYAAFGPQALERAILVFAISTVLLFGLTYLATIAEMGAVGNVSFMYGGARFRGWSENPNQAALIIGISVPLLIRHVIERGGSMLIFAPLVMLGVLSGLAVYSNALQVAWALGLGVSIAASKRLGHGFRMVEVSVPMLLTLLFKVVAAGFVVAGTLWLLNNFQILFEGTAKGMASGQGAARLILWRHAFEAFLQAPLIGHGPGHFSGMAGPFMGSEAHNLLLDWLTSYGLVGVLILFGYLVLVGVGLLRKGSFAVLAVFGVLVLVSTFHFFGRHPAFWFTLFYCGFVAFQRRFDVR